MCRTGTIRFYIVLCILKQYCTIATTYHHNVTRFSCTLFLHSIWIGSDWILLCLDLWGFGFWSTFNSHAARKRMHLAQRGQAARNKRADAYLVLHTEYCNCTVCSSNTTVRRQHAAIRDALLSLPAERTASEARNMRNWCEREEDFVSPSTPAWLKLDKERFRFPRNKQHAYEARNIHMRLLLLLLQLWCTRIIRSII